jgi:hypothetical protein
MQSKGKYKFKLINGILSWKNEEMERFMPVPAEVLTRVIMLYEKEFKTGIRLWKQLEEGKGISKSVNPEDPRFLELTDWMEQLQGIFSNMEPYREKEKWMDDRHIHLN